VTEDNEQRTTRKLARQRMAIEALILFLFAWLTTMVISLLRPSPSAASEGFVLFHFKQFKTGCAFAIILFFAYLLWAGRHR
jgi:Na+/melibiose symporter-like transporter